jgi:hypothetical protein
MRDAQGVHGSGPTKYTPAEYALLCGILKACKGVPLTVAVLAEVTNMDGNTVRAIARDADGVEFVLSESSKGYMAAQTLDAANKGTRCVHA